MMMKNWPVLSWKRISSNTSSKRKNTFLPNCKNESRTRAAIDQYTHGLSEEIRQQMAPLIEDSIRVYDWAVARLSKHGLTPTKADLLLKGNVNSGDNPADPGFAFEHELAAEFRHTVHHVTVTALKLKRFM